MLTRWMAPGETFDYVDKETGKPLVRVQVKGITPDGEAILGFLQPAGVTARPGESAAKNSSQAG